MPIARKSRMAALKNSSSFNKSTYDRLRNLNDILLSKEKAAKSEADVIFLDLEDAVAPDDKEKARENIIQALNDVDFGNKIISVRINGLDTHYMYRDVIDVIEQGGERLDLIMIPKVGTAQDVYSVDMLVTQAEN